MVGEFPRVCEAFATVATPVLFTTDPRCADPLRLTRAPVGQDPRGQAVDGTLKKRIWQAEAHPSPNPRC